MREEGGVNEEKAKQGRWRVKEREESKSDRGGT